MSFRDLDELLVVEPIVLPIHGKEYAFPGSIDGKTWLKIQRIGTEYGRAAAVDGYDPDAEAITDVEQNELLAAMCGETLEEMLTDGVRSEELKLVLMTLTLFHLYDRETAEMAWNNQGKAPAPNREARRATAKSARRRGSQGSSSRQPPKTASPGERSSSTGD